MDNRAHRPGGMGSPAQGVVGASCRACGDVEPGTPAWGDGESSPGGGRSLLPGQWGAIFLRKPGTPAWGGRGVQPKGCSESPARPTGGHLLQRTGRTGLGGTGSPAQGVFGASCQANGGPISSENRAHLAGGDGESCPGGVRSLLPGLRGAIFFREPGAPARGGRGVLPRGCSEPPARAMGGHLLLRTGRTGLGGTGSPAQGVFGVSCKASGGPSSSENRAHRPGGDGESCPGGVRSLLPGQWGAIFFREPGAPAWGGRGVQPRGCSEPPARAMGGHLLQRTGRTGLGGTGSPAQGVFGVSCKASGGPSSSENRAHRPGGDGESCPGGVRSLLPGQWGAIFFREPGAPAWGGRGVQPRGCSESPARANGGPSSSENRAHLAGGDGESCPGGVRSLLPGPMGGHLLQRTGRTGLGGTGSPAQGVFGVSCKASGGPSSSENRAHQPGGDGESCPGGVRSLLPGPTGGHLLQRTGRTWLGATGSSAQGVFRVSCQGQRGAIFFREPGAPGWGGRGVLPRGCSESPARANGGPSSSENRAHRPGGDGESCPGGVRSLLQGQWGAIFFREPGAPARGGRGVLPRGCSESPARPVGGHLLQRTGRTGLGGTGSSAQGVFRVSCQGQRGAIFFREPGAPGWGGRGVLPRGCSESPARANGGPSSSENRAHRPGGDGESCPGGVRSLLQGQWGAIFFREPGAPARGGRGVLPRGCSESPARANGGPSSSENRAHRPGGDGESRPGGVRSLLPGPMGGHLLPRTGRTGLGGTGSPAQGVFGVSCKASGGPSSSENRAHRPGGDGESCPGGVRSLLPGQWGAIFFGELGAPAWGGRGAQPRGCSEPPAGPVGTPSYLLAAAGK